MAHLSYTLADDPPAITLVETETALNQCVFALAECGSPWGVDCEWVMGGPVELLQICTAERCFLIRLPYCPNRGKLEPLLSNAKVIKSGVGIADDAARLFRDYGLSLRGCVGTRYF
jgi:hypothetical protein